MQDPINSSLKESDNGNELKPQNKQQHVQEVKSERQDQPSSLPLPSLPLSDSSYKVKSVKSNSEAQGSYVKYTERLTKHQRTENGI